MLLIDVAEKYIQFNIYNDETARNIRLACRLFDHRSGITDTQTITAEHIGAFKNETLRRAKPVSLNTYMRHIKLVARWGSKEKLIDAENILKLRKAPEPKLKPKAIKPDDLQTILSMLEKSLVPCSWFWAIAIRFFYNVGLRRRQLIELNFEDIDWGRKMLTLSARGSKTLQDWEVPLTDEAQEDLEVLIIAIEAALGRRIQASDRLFNICYFNKRCTADPKDPTRMRPGYLTRIMGKISEATGIKIGAHRLRHTTATVLCNPKDPIETKPDLFFVQKVLGHTDIRTTRLYVETVMENRHDYMSSMLALNNRPVLEFGKAVSHKPVLLKGCETKD